MSQYDFGTKIKILRKKKSLSQIELETLCDIPFGSLSKIENNKVNPTKETLYKIAIALSLELSEILDLFMINEISQMT